MSFSFIDLFNHIISYNEKTVYIAFDSKTFQPYFNANDICNMLGYNNSTVALKTNVPKEYTMKLSDIDPNYKRLYKNVQGNTKFLNESGLYKLIFSSRKKNAVKIIDWFTDQVLPSIRRHGEYKMSDQHKHELEQINNKFHNLVVDLRKQLKEKDDEINILHHNMKTRKHPVDNSLYLVRTIEVSLDLDRNEVISIKMGLIRRSETTKNPNNRFSVLNTTTKNNVQLLKLVQIDDARTIESCVFAQMKHSLSKIKKDYINSSYNDVMRHIARCVKFYNNIDIDVPIKISRPNDAPKFAKFDRNKIYRIHFEIDLSDQSDAQKGGYKNIMTPKNDLLTQYIDIKNNYKQLTAQPHTLKYANATDRLIKSKHAKQSDHNQSDKSGQLIDRLYCMSKEIDNLSQPSSTYF
jgi:prophage antirepressor-like protein